jgi:uncharacterized cupredoxin-like copper-binding protein
MGSLSNPRSIAAIVLAAATCVALFLLAPTPGPAGAEPTFDGAVEVALGDGAIEIDEAVVPAGRTRLSVVNEGSGPHEFLLVRTDLEPAELPVGLFGVSLARAGELVVGEDHTEHVHDYEEALGLAIGQTLSANPRLKPGRYVILCNIEGHYNEGEFAELIVTPRGA